MILETALGQKADTINSRFFTESDPRAERVIFRIPDYWWSRPSEYAWAVNVAKPGTTVLDAASGICHPLKFKLFEMGCTVKACDLDERILSPEAIRDEVLEVFGEEDAVNLKPEFMADIDYSRASLTALPYVDKTFDSVFCISVLEHLPDSFNANYRRLRPFKRLVQPFVKQDISKTLSEFKRILKDDGQIALTFDFPRINLEYLVSAAADNGLTFAGEVQLAPPEDALFAEKHGLRCFRALLEKVDV